MAIVSFICALLAVSAMGVPIATGIMVSALCAVGVTLVEAFSSHGLDNLTIQVAASLIAYLILS